ncbi:MAG: hypothetical protein IJM59_10735 [Proteobacteria bacterium]|nr:hypothetical protein [Pseudomonadota bacterium]
MSKIIRYMSFLLVAGAFLACDDSDNDRSSNPQNPSVPQTNPGNQTQTPPNGGNQTQTPPNGGNQTQTPPNGGNQTQNPPDGGKQDQNPPDDGKQDQNPPDDGKQDQNPPDDGKQDQNPPDDGKQDQNPPDDGKQDQNPPDDGKQDQNPPDDGKQDQNPPDDKNGTDPCKDIKCTKGTCLEGVCVTDAMKAIQDGDECDPVTFVDFCDGSKITYCDHGIVIHDTCDEGCAVYEETYFGLKRQRAGCIDGGDCTKLDELRRTCGLESGVSQVLATACQKTTRDTLKWISVSGYYCKGSCDAKGEKCELVESAKECDPYDKSSYKCDRRNIVTCYLNSNLIASKRSTSCDDKCIKLNGVAMCGFACQKEGELANYCINADSMSIEDSGQFICQKTDDGNLYRVWTSEYEVCDDDKGCDHSTGECK